MLKVLHKGKYSIGAVMNSVVKKIFEIKRDEVAGDWETCIIISRVKIFIGHF